MAEAGQRGEHLRLVPCTVSFAKKFILHHHRHNPPPQSALFAVACEREDGTLVGVATVGRPVSRVLQAEGYVEATRVCTDGTFNSCSFLVARARRAALALGYEQGKFITYTLVDEGGASIRGAGLRTASYLEARSWGDSSVARPRTDKHTQGDRFRWDDQELPDAA